MIFQLAVLYRWPLLALIAFTVSVIIICGLAKNHWRAVLLCLLTEVSVGTAIWPVLKAVYQRPIIPLFGILVALVVIVATAYRFTQSEGLRIFWLTGLVVALGAAIPPVLEALYREPLPASLIVFALGLATACTLFKLATSSQIIKERTGRLVLLCAGLVAFLAVAAWPLLCSILLFTDREYLLAAIPLIYAFPYYFGVALVLKPILTLVKIAREQGASAAQTQFQTWSDEWHDNIKSEALPEEAINKHREGYYWRHLSKLLSFFQTLAMAPQAAFWILAIFRFGKRVPLLVDFNTPFFVLFTFLAYLVANAGHPVMALLLSAYLFLLKLYEVTSRFDTRSGVLKKLLQEKHHVRISDIAFAAAIMASSFGCIHYCISILNPSAYSRPLTAIDGLYFSVTTFATVGYGDIYPTRDVSKLACIAEIASGCLVLLFGVNLAMMVWFGKFTDGRERPTEIAAPSSSEAIEAPPCSATESRKAPVTTG